MPARQVARFPLTGGMDTKSDEKHIPVPKLEIAKNVDLSTPGAIDKRRALKADGAGSQATLLGGGKRYHVELGPSTDGGYAFAFGASGESLQNLPISAPGITTAQVLHSNVEREYAATPMAMYGGELHCLVIGDKVSTGNVESKMIVLDPDTMEQTSGTDAATLYNFNGNSGMTTPHARLLPTSNGVVAVWCDTVAGEIRAQGYGAGAWRGIVKSLVAGVAGGTHQFDAAVNAAGTKLWVSTEMAGGATTETHGFDYDGSTWTSMGTPQSEALVGTVALALDESLDNLVLTIAAGGASHELFEYSDDLATRVYGYVIDAAPSANLSGAAIAVLSDTYVAVWIEDRTIGEIHRATVRRSPTRATTSNTYYKGCRIAHRPFAHAGGWCMGMARQTDDGSPVYATIWSSDPTTALDRDQVLATYGHGGLPRVASGDQDINNELHVAPYTTPTGMKWFWGGGLRQLVQLASGGSILSSHGAAVLSLELAAPKMYGHAFAHDTLMVAGSIPTAIVGGRAMPAGFIHRPHISSTAGGGVAGGSMAPGSMHNVIVVFEVYDDLGRMWRSAPSEAVPVTLGGGDTSFTANVEPPIIADWDPETTPNIRLAVYATVAGGTGVYYRSNTPVNESIGTSFSDAGVGASVPGYGVYSDALLATKEVLYTDLGELSHSAPPPCSVIVQHKNRFAAIHSETGDIWLSLELVRGEGVHWSPVLSVINGSTGDKPTALVSTDSALVVFYRDRVGYIYGDGPSNQGLGQGFTTVQFLPDADVGAISQQTVAKLPMGIFFCDPDKGWHVLPYGGGAAQYVGMDMDGPPTEVIVGTAHLPERQEVRAAFYNAETYKGEDASWVTWHYDVGQWSIGQADDHDTANLYALADGNEFIFDGVGEDAEPGYDGASTYVSMRILTGWITMQEATRKQGLHRLWTLYLMAEALDEHSLAVALTYDYSALGEGHVLAARDVGDTEELRVDPAKQLIQAFKVDMYDAASGGTDTGKGYRLSDLEIHFGVYPGVKPRRSGAGRMTVV